MVPSCKETVSSLRQQVLASVLTPRCHTRPSSIPLTINDEVGVLYKTASTRLFIKCAGVQVPSCTHSWLKYHEACFYFIFFPFPSALVPNFIAEVSEQKSSSCGSCAQGAFCLLTKVALRYRRMPAPSEKIITLISDSSAAVSSGTSDSFSKHIIKIASGLHECEGVNLPIINPSVWHRLSGFPSVVVRICEVK